MDKQQELKNKVLKGLYECCDTNGACSCCPYAKPGVSQCRYALIYDVFTLMQKEVYGREKL